MVAGMETNKENINIMPNEAKYIVFLDRNSAVAPEKKFQKKKIINEQMIRA